MLPTLHGLARPLLLAFGMTVAAGCAVPEAPEGRGESSSAIANQPPVVRYFEDLDQAEKKVKETDERFARAAARVSPLLTETQQREFARGFQELPEVRAAAAAYRTAAEALDKELARLLADDDLLDALLGSATFGGPRVFEAYVRLARSPSPAGALAFALRKLGDDPRLARVTARPGDVVERVLVPALPGAFLEKLVASRSKDAAMSSLAAALATSGGECDRVVAWLEKPFALGETAGARDLLVAGKSVGRALNAVAGLIVLWDLGGDLARGDVDASIAALRDGGATAVGGIVDATSLVRRLLIHSERSALDGVIKVGGRLAGGISLLSSIFTLAADLDREAWGRVAVDLVAIAGAVMAIAGVGPAMPVAVLAIGLGIFVDWLDDSAREAELRRDAEASLRRTSVNAALAAPIAKAEPYLIQQLTKELRLRPEQIQWLVSVDDLALTFDGDSRNTFDYQGLLVTQRIFSLDASATVALLRSAVGGETNPERRRAMVEDLLFMFADISYGWSAALDVPGAIAWLDRDPAGRFVFDDAELALHQTMVANVRRFLAAR